MKKSITPGSAPRLFAELVNIMARLRGPNGCPWDKHQTNSSLVKYLLEEAGEVRSAVRKKDWENLAEELGDVLLQVVFHSQIAQEKGLFTVSDVVSGINRKLIRRHPHVFGNKKADTPKDVIRQWNEIKRQEKREQRSARRKK